MTLPSFDMLADGSALDQGASALLGNPGPSDHNLLGWSYDPLLTRASGAPTAGTIYLAAIYLRSSVPVARKIWWINGATGATVTAAQNWAGLIRQDGIVLGSVGIDAKNTAGAQNATFTSAIRNLSAGLYWAALVWNGAALPTLAKMDPAAIAAHVVGLTDVATYRFGVAAVTQTAMPAAIVTANITNPAGAIPFWAGISK